MRQRMNIALLIMNIALLVLYVLVIADFVVSVVWAGFAQTASGLTIPDSSLMLPAIFFIVISAVQTAFCFTKRDNSAFSLAVIIIKAAFVFVSLWMTNYYVFNKGYYGGSNWGDFYSNGYNTVIVSAFIALAAVCVVLEFVRQLYKVKFVKPQ